MNTQHIANDCNHYPNVKKKNSIMSHKPHIEREEQWLCFAKDRLILNL